MQVLFIWHIPLAHTEDFVYLSRTDTYMLHNKKALDTRASTHVPYFNSAITSDVISCFEYKVLSAAITVV